MKPMRLIAVVLNRDQQKEYIHYFQQHGCNIVYTTPCHGTAKHALLNTLGLEATEKLLLLATADSDSIPALLTALQYTLKLDYAGNGIAFTIPIQSIGIQSLRFFQTEDSISSSKTGGIMKKDDTTQAITCDYELIIAIANSGYTDMVMDTARSASASGGTVIHAKSTATEEMRKFLGISIVEEKEILMIVTTKEQTDSIMKAIQKTSGIHTDAGTVLFSLPVDSVAGLHFSPAANLS